MQSTYKSLALLLAYLVLVFLTFRVLDLVIWLQHGVSSAQIVDPILLSVRHLKQLLEVRGVSYTGYVEKQELAKLVEESADVSQSEIDELSEIGGGGNSESERERLSTMPTPSYFTGATHFYEEVEDTKDSVWLVQVVPATRQNDGPLLDDYTWRVVRTHVAPFAIRTGIFDCKLDLRLCNSKSWHQPLLLLALPRGTKPKDRVIMTTCRLKRPQAIIDWLREELSIRVKKIPSYEELETDWLESNTTSTSDANKAVKVLLLTHLLHPPLFLAALSIKFTGRISFGIFSVKKEEVQRVGKVPSYLIVTPETTVTYGRRKMEHFNFRSMNAYLKTIQPELNDIFLCSLLLVNMFAGLHILLTVPVDSWWKILVESIWTVVVQNLCLFAAWLLLLGTMRWAFLATASEWWLGMIRQLALTDFGSLVRSDWIKLTRSPWVLFTSLVSFGVVARSRIKHETLNSSPNRRRWWEIECLFRAPDGYPSEITQPVFPEIELEEGIEMLIERLAVPHFWLQPVVSTDYIKELFVWKYRGHRSVRKDSPEMIKRMMDSEDDSVVRLPHQLSSDTVSVPDLGQDFVIKPADCAICLDRYRPGAILCALPCGHNYHHKCIMEWLHRDHHHCPICRWPAYKAKPI